MSAFDIRDLLEAAAPLEAQPAGAIRSRGVPLAETAMLAPQAISPVVVAGLVRALEVTLIAALGGLLHLTMLHGRVPFGLTYAGVIALISVTTVALFQAAGGYRIAALRMFFKTTIRLIAAWSTTFLVVAAVLVVAKVADHYSRLWLGAYFGCGLGLLLVVRFVMSRVVGAQSRGRPLRPAHGHRRRRPRRART